MGEKDEGAFMGNNRPYTHTHTHTLSDKSHVTAQSLYLTRRMDCPRIDLLFIQSEVEERSIPECNEAALLFSTPAITAAQTSPSPQEVFPPYIHLLWPRES